MSWSLLMLSFAHADEPQDDQGNTEEQEESSEEDEETSPFEGLFEDVEEEGAIPLESQPEPKKGLKAEQKEPQPKKQPAEQDSNTEDSGANTAEIEALGLDPFCEKTVTYFQNRTILVDESSKQKVDFGASLKIYWLEFSNKERQCILEYSKTVLEAQKDKLENNKSAEAVERLKGKDAFKASKREEKSTVSAGLGVSQNTSKGIDFMYDYRYEIPDQGLFTQLSYWSKRGLRARVGADLYHFDSSDQVSSITNGWLVLDLGLDAVFLSNRSINLIVGGNTEFKRLSYPSGYQLCDSWYYGACPDVELGSLDAELVLGLAYRFKRSVVELGVVGPFDDSSELWQSNSSGNVMYSYTDPELYFSVHLGRF